MFASRRLVSGTCHFFVCLKFSSFGFYGLVEIFNYDFLKSFGKLM